MHVPDDHTPLEDLLRRRNWEGAAGGELCDNAELLAAYAEGQLPQTARDRLEQHLATCAACQAAVVRLVRLAPQESAAGAAAAGTQTARAPRTPLLFRWRWALPALVGVILTGSFIYYERFQIVAPRPSTAPGHVAEHVAPESEPSTGESHAYAPTPQVPAEVATSRGVPLDEADRAREVGETITGGTTVGGTPVGVTTAAVGTEEQERLPQTRRELHGGFAEQFTEKGARAAAPLPAAAPPPSPSAPPSAAPPEAERLAYLESPAESARKTKAGPQVLDDAFAQRASEEQAKSSVANELADRPRAQSAPKPSRSKDLRRMQAEPKNAAKSVLTLEGRLAKRDDLAEKKEIGSAEVEARRQRGAGGSSATTGLATGLKGRDAQTYGPFRKQIPAATHRLALTVSGLLLGAPAESNEWQPMAIPTGPSGAEVTDFTVFRDHLWVLLPGGRVAHSADLGRSWDPVVETGAKDPVTISFTNALTGEILTRSGRRLRTTDGGQSWQPTPR